MHRARRDISFGLLIRMNQILDRRVTSFASVENKKLQFPRPATVVDQVYVRGCPPLPSAAP